MSNSKPVLKQSILQLSNCAAIYTAGNRIPTTKAQKATIGTENNLESLSALLKL